MYEIGKIHRTVINIIKLMNIELCIIIEILGKKYFFILRFFLNIFRIKKK